MKCLKLGWLTTTMGKIVERSARKDKVIRIMPEEMSAVILKVNPRIKVY